MRAFIFASLAFFLGAVTASQGFCENQFVTAALKHSLFIILIKLSPKTGPTQTVVLETIAIATEMVSSYLTVKTLKLANLLPSGKCYFDSPSTGCSPPGSISIPCP